MMQTTRKVSRDPRPWRYVFINPDGQMRAAKQETGGFVYDPRPEYDTFETTDEPQ